MENIYTISTVDDPEYKRLLCGRRSELETLLDHISRGHSIALFGERRIGKTSVVWLLRDIIGESIAGYEHRLIDEGFQADIKSLKTHMPPCKVIYLDLTSRDPKLFASSITNELCKAFPEQDPAIDEFARKSDFVSIAQAANGRLPVSSRLVIFLDEIDVLLDSRNSKQIFRSLRSIVQSCPRICFVMAGAELWHRAIKEKTSPLVNNIYTFYLRSGDTASIRKYLVRKQLANYLASSENIDEILTSIETWTGWKPWYVQAICYEIVETCRHDQPLPANWQEVIEAKTVSAVGPTLRAFFEGENLDNSTRKILALLANKPGASIKEMQSVLGGCSSKAVRDKLSDLHDLGKVRKQGARYYIVGTLLENYGKNTQDVINSGTKWSQHLRWIAAFILILSAVGLYWYSNPPITEHTFPYRNVTLSIRVPSSLEQDEIGTAAVLVHNTSQSEIFSVTLSLVSNDIDYQHAGSNRFVLQSLLSNEIRYWQPSFYAHPTAQAPILSSSITISDDSGQGSATYPFEIPRRAVPIKKFTTIAGILLLAVSTFLTKHELWTLIVNLAALFKSESRPETVTEHREKV